MNELLIGNGKASLTLPMKSKKKPSKLIAFRNRLHKLGWRKAFINAHIDAGILPLLANESDRDVIYMHTQSWIERYGTQDPESFEGALHAIGLRRTVAHKIAGVLEPLHDTCYSHTQLLEIAVEYASGKYKPIGIPGHPFLFNEAIVDEWVDHPTLKRIYNCSNTISLESQALDAIADLPPTSGQSTLFFHATNWQSAVNIATYGIDRTRGRRCLDFGIQPGFYLTPDINVGVQWCQTNASRWDKELCIMVFVVQKPALLNSKTFKAANKEWQQLVSHSRHCQGATNALDWVDTVYGPMAANVKAMVENRAIAKTHASPKMQLASKSNLSDRALSECYVGTLFFSSQLTLVL